MHAVFVLELVGGVEAVLPARAGNDAVIMAVVAAMPIAKRFELAFALLPVDVPLVFREAAGITYTVAIKSDCGLLRRRGVLKLDCRVGPLVRDYAFRAESYLAWQTIERFQVSRVCRHNARLLTFVKSCR